jgi:hypothetical protein
MVFQKSMETLYLYAQSLKKAWKAKGIKNLTSFVPNEFFPYGSNSFEKALVTEFILQDTEIQVHATTFQAPIEIPHMEVPVMENPTMEPYHGMTPFRFENPYRHVSKADASYWRVLPRREEFNILSVDTKAFIRLYKST